MKLCNFFKDGQVHVGMACPGGAADLTSAGLGLSMDELIRDGGDVLLHASGAPVIPEAELVFANVTTPSKILCVGLNYKSHAEETGGTAPEQPVLFSKFNDTLSPACGGISLPPWQRCYDYEAELVIVMSRHAWNVSKEDAMNCVFGYTCGNDLSARDSQFISNQWLIGKTFPGFAPCGPWIVTPDEFDPDRPHRISCRVNGQTVQDDHTSGMLFSCAEIISYASRFLHLSPGDLIFTGTPSGVILGKPKEERVWLKAGDRVCVSIEGIGILENTLI